MSYDDSHWNEERAVERDFEREASPVGRVPRQLDARGSVKQQFRPACTDHEQAKNDNVKWGALKQIGVMPAYEVDTDGNQLVLVLANCPRCASTLAREELPRTEEAINVLRREGLL